MTLLIMMLRKIANFTVVGVVDMINNEIRDFIAEEHEEAVVFNVPSYDNAIVGLSDDGRIIYDYDLMIKELTNDTALTEDEAIQFIDYNTIRTLPYMEETFRPIILYNSTIIKEIKNDSDKT